jgi:hypothetical protein
MIHISGGFTLLSGTGRNGKAANKCKSGTVIFQNVFYTFDK